MKIGILIGRYKDLEQWELRIIQKLFEDPKLKLAVLVQDNPIENSQNKNELHASTPRPIAKFALGRWVLGLQLFIEEKIIFKEKPFVDKAALIAKLKGIDVVDRATLLGDQDVLRSSKALEKMQNDGLDVLLNLSTHTFPSKLLGLSKYGIWELIHTDAGLNRVGPTGFWEVLNKEPIIGSTLVRQTHGSQGDEIVDRAYFNRDWAYCSTQKTVVEASVSLVFKNIEKIKKGSFSLKQPELYTKPLTLDPNLWDSLKYIIQFYGNLSQKIIEKLFYGVLGIRQECWVFFLGKGTFLDLKSMDIEPVKLPRGEAWADPFLFRYKGAEYVFFENYSYKNKRAKISCAQIKGNKIVGVKDVLITDYHLSYPFIFEEEGELFLMPETSENRRLELYKCVNFPSEWELYATAFEGESVADAFFHNDEDGQKWLFINKQAASTTPLNSELYIYKVESLRLNNLQPHAQNPVLIDARVARNGGAIFKHDNKLYRPSQRNVDGIYGKALNINQIEALSLAVYKERTVRVVEPNFNKKLMALHHLHQIDGAFVFDAAYKSN